MAEYVVKIEMGNAAFDDNPNELSELFDKLAEKIESGEDEFSLRDSNGNTVCWVNSEEAHALDQCGLVMTLDTGNSAFEDYQDEVRNVLSLAEQKIASGHEEFPLIDTNGNKVGNAVLVTGQAQKLSPSW
jgi:hypothetical protein